MKNLLSYFPLLVITALMLYSVYSVGTSDLIFSYEHYLALVFIFASWLSWRFNVIISKLSTLLVLILAVFSQAAFTPVILRHRIGYTINGHGFDILLQPYCVLLLVFFLIVNRRFLRSIFKAQSKGSDDDNVS